jgi:protein-L-isoaspartate(D-aspartate) O-methyltransferase
MSGMRQVAARSLESRFAWDGSDDRLRHAFSVVAREEFIEPALGSRAGEDISLPIGFGQTISKPSTVARMLSSLELSAGERVLEVGTGSGYVLALLGALGVNGFGIERIAALGRIARKRLDRLGYQDLLLKVGDGMRGWSELAPFDAIIVSAAVDAVPNVLFSQLSKSGRLVVPLNVDPAPCAKQRLILFRLGENGEMCPEDLGACHFVAAT